MVGGTALGVDPVGGLGSCLVGWFVGCPVCWL